MSESLCEEKGPVIIVSGPSDPAFYQIKKNPELSNIPEMCTFSEFLQWNYTNDYENLIRYCLKSQKIHPCCYNDTTNISLNHTKINHVYLHRIDDVSLRIDTVVAAVFDVTYANFQQRQKTQWYRIQGTFQTQGRSSFFERISVYNKNDIPQAGALSEYLVPFLSKNDLESEAEMMLQKYYPEALECPVRINVKLLAERMGFKVKTTRLSLDDSKLGRVFFKDADIVYYVNEQPRKANVKAKTILIDIQAHKNREYNVSDTVTHECIHIYEHYLFYHLQSLYHSFINENLPEFEDMITERSEDDPVKWIEHQAYHMTPRVRMPLKQTSVKVSELFSKYEKLSETLAYDRVISDLSEFYDVSMTMAADRLAEMRYIRLCLLCMEFK